METTDTVLVEIDFGSPSLARSRSTGRKRLAIARIFDLLLSEQLRSSMALRAFRSRAPIKLSDLVYLRLTSVGRMWSSKKPECRGL